MRYVSTRDTSLNRSAAQAIARGLSSDGGLYSPYTLPELTPEAVKVLCGLDYVGRAVLVMRLFLEDFSESELRDYAAQAYDPKRFEHPAIAPVRKLEDGLFFLELWHGPTCAFKDMALQMLPHLLTASLKKTGETKKACILVATSGDTGKAALEGFRDVEGTCILVFYPEDGVSDIQKLQMTTQEGENVGVCAVKGNFDDAQNGVKAIFSDEALRNALQAKNVFLSSANSINWGRLLPQIVYYISAYCDLINQGEIGPGEKINFCVPTGNFGNILAGYFARSMGLPINKLICASNVNHVLTDFFETGVYDRNRNLVCTISPSMDILISSNLERLLFELTEKDGEAVRGYMKSLSEQGCYQITRDLKEKLDAVFAAGFSGEEETKQAIKKVYEQFGYLMDTHTAVAYDVLTRYRKDSEDHTPCVVVSTASPFKFCDSVLSALGSEEERTTGFSLLTKLSEKTGCGIPVSLEELKTKQVRFTRTVKKEEMKKEVAELAGLIG
jgi:threonine synthase